MTGGEPLLQLNQTLVDYFKNHGVYIAIETNGTLEAPSGIDWLCVSPKPNTEIVQISGQELKFIYPQTPFSPNQFESLAFLKTFSFNLWTQAIILKI